MSSFRHLFIYGTLMFSCVALDEFERSTPRLNSQVGKPDVKHDLDDCFQRE